MPKPSGYSRKKLSWQKKLAFASLTTAMFFLGLEAGLALLGVQRITEKGDPFVGFSSQVPLFESETDSEGRPILRTAPGKLVWFNPQSFPAKKPASTRRVFCVGGSTTFGRPFSDSTSYCGWLRQLLPMVDSSVKWEVVNAGGVSYASYRVAAVMEELAQYEPDLFIVYSGHNEFLERRTYEGMFETSPLRRDFTAALQKTRTWSLVDRLVGPARDPSEPRQEQLSSEVDEMLNHSIGPSAYHRDDVWRDKVLRHYEWNLARMVTIAREAGAAIVFVTPASNLRDCSPFKSESSREFSDDQIAETEQQLELVQLMLDQQRFEEALETCSEILVIDARHAGAHYLAGQALFGIGRYDEAERAFQRAMEEDVCPLRATTRNSDIIRRVAGRESVPVIDFVNQLASKCQDEQGHGCLGREHFLDHVHPTVDAHRDLAVWIIAELQNQAIINGRLPNEADLAQVQQRVNQGIDTTAQGIAFRNLAKVLHWSGKFREAAPRARDAIKLIPADMESHFVLADCLENMGRHDEAFEEYKILFTIGDYPRAFLPFGELLAKRGDFSEAKPYLLQAVASDNDEHRARAHYVLGLVHLQLGEYAFAAESLRESDQLYPNDPATLTWLGDAQLGVGEADSAIELFQRAIALDESYFDAHYELGMTYLSQNNLVDARRHIEIAAKLAPANQQVIEAVEMLDALEQ